MIDRTQLATANGTVLNDLRISMNGNEAGLARQCVRKANERPDANGRAGLKENANVTYGVPNEKILVKIIATPHENRDTREQRETQRRWSVDTAYDC